MDILPAYASTYLLVDLLCIVMSVIIIRKVGVGFGSELEIRYFKRLIGFHLTYCVADMLWFPLNYGLLPANRNLNALLCVISMMAVCFTAYSWFCYAHTNMRESRIESTTFLSLAQLPLVAAALLYVTNPLTGIMFGFDAAGSYVAGPFAPLVIVLGGIYVAAVAGQALWHMAHEPARHRREMYHVFVIGGIFPLMACVYSVVFRGTPVIALGILSAILLVFSSLQDSRIFNDSLTGLNNRRRADQYLAEKIGSASSENAVYLYVLDVDLFKSINDTQGHMEGDHALQVVADGLRHVAGKSNGFIARWGGDEFVLVVDGKDVESPDEVVSTIDECMACACVNAGVSYRLSVSSGYAACTSPSDDPDDLLTRADSMLYEQKRRVHAKAA